MFKKQIIKHNVYPFKYVLVKGDFKEVCDYFSNITGKAIENTPGCTYEFNGNVYIYLGDGKIHTLVHELVHAVQLALDTVDIETGVDNTEILAYEIEFLLVRAMIFFDNRNNGKTIKG